MTGASFAVSFMLAGRGGSVSRRDHNPKTRKRAHLAWARTSEGRTKPIPSRSSGEGVWGRGASLREAASPPESPHRSLSGREREGGAFLKKGSLPRILSLSHNFFEKGLALFGKMGYNKDVSFVNVRVLR